MSMSITFPTNIGIGARRLVRRGPLGRFVAPDILAPVGILGMIPRRVTLLVDTRTLRIALAPLAPVQGV